jgi:hypothetical protein
VKATVPFGIHTNAGTVKSTEGTGLTTTDVEAVDVQLFSVAVIVYVPLLEVSALAMVGFCTALVKPVELVQA